MTYIFMAVHYPAAGKLDEAFEAAVPGSGVPSETVHPGESGPREYFHLEPGA